MYYSLFTKSNRWTSDLNNKSDKTNNNNNKE